MSEEATIGVGIITRDSLATLRPLLEQLAQLDQVVVIDTGSRDGTAAYLSGLGPPFESHRFKWRPTPRGRPPDEWGFAAARNESFSHLRTTHGAWFDSDDQLVNVQGSRREPASASGVARTLRTAIAEWPQADVFQLEYVYRRDEYGHPATVLAPDRMVRLAAGWRWRFPVHEGLATTGDPERVRAFAVRQLSVEHLGADDKGSLERNEAMLRAWLRQLRRAGAPPEEMSRPEWLMARTLRGLGRHRESNRWLLREYLGKHPDLSPDSRWAGWIDLARGLFLTGELEAARLAALRAIDQRPNYEEAYVLLADIKATAGDEPEDILKLLEVAASCRDSDHVAHESLPAYVDFASSLLGAESRLRLGRFADALPYAERALQMRPGHERARRAWVNAHLSTGRSPGNETEGAPSAPSVPD